MNGWLVFCEYSTYSVRFQSSSPVHKNQNDKKEKQNKKNYEDRLAFGNCQTDKSQYYPNSFSNMKKERVNNYNCSSYRWLHSHNVISYWNYWFFVRVLSFSLLSINLYLFEKISHKSRKVSVHMWSNVEICFVFGSPRGRWRSPKVLVRTCRLICTFILSNRCCLIDL